MYRKTPHPDAPSTSAASYGSYGSDCSPPSKIRDTKGRFPQVSMIRMETMAEFMPRAS